MSAKETPKTFTAQALNYGLGPSTLWVVFIFEKILESINAGGRLVVDGYQLDSPKFNQESDATITVKQIRKRNWLAPMLRGNTSTSITTTKKLLFGMNVTGDQGRIYDLFFYHYYTGSPQFIAWNEEFAEQYKYCVPEWGQDVDVDINNSDSYAVGQSWLISFLHTLDYSSSPDNLENISTEGAINAEYE